MAANAGRNLEVSVFRHQTETLVFGAHFASGQSEAGMLLQQPNYSRYTVAILKAGGNGNAPVQITANIPIADVSAICDAKNAVINLRTMMSAKIVSCEGGSTSASASADDDPQLPFADKAAGRRLRVSEKAATLTPDEIRSQIAWFQSNLAKYPANQVFVDAFQRELAKKTGSGPSVNESASGVQKLQAGSIVLYNEPNKFLVKRTQRNDGRVFVYGISIEYVFGKKYPYIITINNGYAPLHEMPGGGTIIDHANEVERVEASFKLSDKEGDILFQRLYDVARDFEAATFEGRYRAAQRSVGQEMNKTPDAIQTNEKTFASAEQLAMEAQIRALRDEQASMASRLSTIEDYVGAIYSAVQNNS